MPAARRPAHDQGAQGRPEGSDPGVLRRRAQQHGALVRARLRHRRHARARRLARVVRPARGRDRGCRRLAAETGGSITLYTDPLEAAAGADVVVTDTWVSMGKEEEKLARLRDLGEYKVTQELMTLAARCDLHPLPSRRPRLRGRRRGHRRTAERRVGRGREPAARPEGAAGVAAAPGLSGAAQPWRRRTSRRRGERRGSQPLGPPQRAAARRRGRPGARPRGDRHVRRAPAVDPRRSTWRMPPPGSPSSTGARRSCSRRSRASRSGSSPAAGGRWRRPAARSPGAGWRARGPAVAHRHLR